MEWVGFQKNYVIFKVGHWKLLRPLTRWVGGVKKGQKHAYVVFEWSLTKKEPKFENHLTKFDWPYLSPIFLAIMLFHDLKVF